MSVHKYRTKNGHTRWRVMWRDSTGRQHSRSFAAHADARLADAGVRLGIAPEPISIPVIEAGMTVNDWVVEWFELYSREWADGTVVNRKSIFEKWILPMLGREVVTSLGKKRIRSFREAIVEKGGSAYTANKCVRELSACLGAAVDNDLIENNPCVGIKRLTEAPAKTRALTPDEVEQLRAAVPTERDRLIISLIAYAGLRPAEVCGLTWAHVGTELILVEQSAQAGRIKTTKTGKSRSVPIIASLAEDITAHGRGADDELVVCGDRGGVLPWGHWATHVWNAATKTTGIKARAYDLRHTYASLMLAGGASVIDTSFALGHSKSSTTLDVYSHAYAQGQLATRVPLDDAIRAARSARAASQDDQDAQ